jgi:heme exporter protein A
MSGPVFSPRLFATVRGAMAGDGDKRDCMLEGRGLACRRGDRLLFAGLDFRIAAGELLLLRGPNGSGKSSLLRLIAGLIPADAGSLFWNGGPILDREAWGALMAYLGHLDGAKSELTVREDLRFWLGWRGLAPASGHRAEEALARLGLDHLADLPCRLLSAGQRRRLALARVAVWDARLWLLDEPFTALDDAATEIARQMIAEHCAAGGLVVMSAHGPVPVLPSVRLLDLGVAVVDRAEAPA